MKLHTLSNGVQITLEKMPHVRSVSFGIWVKNGSRNESLDYNGISHFIEHMLFKGTTKRSARQIADEIDAVGGQINAYTSKEYTCYHTRTLDTHLDTALEILSDMFFNSKFEAADIEKECNVILEEISMYEDTPDELVHDLLQYNVWQGSSLGYPILGTESSISKFDSPMFRKYFKDNYRTDNTLISVAGNFDESELLIKLDNLFGKFEPNSNKSIAEPTIYKPCVVSKEKDIEQVHLVFGFPSIEIGNEDSYSLAVLNTVFGGGMSSRLFQKIREEHGLAYSVYSYNSSYHDAGLFSIYAGLNPSQTEAVIHMVIDEIKNLSREKLTNLQLERTKEQLKSNYLMSLESSSSMMSSIGKGQLMLQRVLTPDEIIEKINKVTLEKIDCLVTKIFDFDQMSLSGVGCLNGSNLQEMIKNAR